MKKKPRAKRSTRMAKTSTLMQSDVIRMVQLLRECGYDSSHPTSYPSTRRQFDVVERAFYLMGETVKVVPARMVWS